MILNWEVNFWQLLTTFGSTAAFALTLYAAAMKIYHLLDKRMDRFEFTLVQHAEMLMTHAKRMDLHEEHNVKLVGDLQRVIGRLEIISPRWAGDDRRRTP